MTEKELDETGILASIHGEYVRVTPPVEGEPEFISQIKTFIFACLARRNMDQDFAGNMQDWLNTTSEDEFMMKAQPIRRQ